MSHLLLVVVVVISVVVDDHRMRRCLLFTSSCIIAMLDVLRISVAFTTTCRHYNNKSRKADHIFDTTSLMRADNLSSYDETPAEEESSKKTRRVRPLRRGAQLSNRAQAQEEQSQLLSKRREIAEQDPNLLVDAKFANFVSPPTSRALMERFGVDRMTVVQARTFARSRAGESLLVQATTGSGKTLAFLVPLLESLLVMDPTQFRPGEQIGLLIVAPTRELAVQTAETANELLAFHSNLSVQAVYGGTSIQRDVRSLEKNLPAILVATPGRLVDLIGDERIRGRKFGDLLKETSMAVIDEADLMVMGGFSKDILKILSHLPRKRQTMLYSATIPKKLQSILPEVCMTSEWSLVDCVEKGKDSGPQIKESLVTIPGGTMDLYVPVLLTLVKELLAASDGWRGKETKIMVFLPAVRMVRFIADVFRQCSKDIPVWEIHSHLSQSARRRVADSFRRTTRGVLFTSDISARGMDYPDVDVVVQYGLPNRPELYLHRIGRTGRAGSTGHAILVPMPFESVNALGGIKRSIKTDHHLASIVQRASLESPEMTMLKATIREKQQPLRGNAEGCVLSLLAFYVANKPAKAKLSAIHSAIETLAKSLGLEGVPELSDSLEKELNNDS